MPHVLKRSASAPALLGDPTSKEKSDAKRTKGVVAGASGFDAQSQALSPAASSSQAGPSSADLPTGIRPQIGKGKKPAGRDAQDEGKGKEPLPVGIKPKARAPVPDVGPAVRSLPAGAKPALDFASQDPQVAAVLAAVGVYNALGADATHQDRFAALQAIDTAAYAAFRDNPVPEFSALPYGEALRALLYASEAAHADLVDDLRQRAQHEDGHLPVDATGMSNDEKAEVMALFASISRGQGDIQVAGDANFQKKTHAGLAKLMQKPLGRQIVSAANRKAAGDGAPDRTINIRPGDSPGAMPRDTTEADMKTTGDSDAPGLKPAEFARAVFSGQNPGVMGGKQLAFGAGTAVDVDMPEQLEESRTQGKNGQEIVTPEFIALGHELGHAAKAKLGAKGTDVGFGVLKGGIQPAKWNNSSEEYLNVKGVENPLRHEHGMAKRGDYTASIKQQRVYELRLAVNQGVQQNPAAAQQLMAIMGRLRENLNDDAVYRSIRDEIQAAVNTPAPVAQAPAPQQGGGGKNVFSRAGRWFRHRFGGR